MTKIALLGAGGKMGVRLAANLLKSRFTFDCVEVSTEARQRLRDATGLHCVGIDEALGGAQVVILAVPDKLIGPVSTEIFGRLEPGTSLVVLDAAAPHAGKMPERDDVTIFVTHPCHPAFFEFGDQPEARRDFFGGVSARQNIVCALMQGPEEHYELCEEVARTIYAPVERSHRCTVEQIAILEPALSETVGATLCYALREAVDEATRRGVSADAARDFMLGHLRIELAIVFDAFPGGRFSEGAYHAIKQARPIIFKDDWLERVFAPEAVLASVKGICES